MKPSVLLVAALCLTGASAPDPPREPARIPPELQQRIHAAIDKGRAFLLARQRADGSFADARETLPETAQGVTALCLQALLKSGAPPNDPAILKGFASCKAKEDDRVYSKAVLMMALEARGEPKAKPAAKDAKPQIRLEAADLAWMQELTRWMLDNRQESPLRKTAEQYGDSRPWLVWSYNKRSSHGWDHSILQYALLGLKSARRCGVEVPRDAFRGPLLHCLASQEKAGAKGPPPDAKPAKSLGGYDAAKGVPRGWGYQPQEHPQSSGSLTCAGLGSLLIAQSELLEDPVYKRSAKAVDAAVRDGFCWLAVNFSVSENPKGFPGYLYYYLYGLERCGAMAQTDRIGSHAWYREGAEWLCQGQNADGSWALREIMFMGPVDPVLETCFALLFLTRATPSLGIHYEVGEEKKEPPP